MTSFFHIKANKGPELCSLCHGLGGKVRKNYNNSTTIYLVQYTVIVRPLIPKPTTRVSPYSHTSTLSLLSLSLLYRTQVAHLL